MIRQYYGAVQFLYQQGFSVKCLTMQTFNGQAVIVGVHEKTMSVLLFICCNSWDFLKYEVSIIAEL